MVRVGGPATPSTPTLPGPPPAQPKPDPINQSVTRAVSNRSTSYPFNRLMPCCWETILREKTTKHVKQSDVREFLTTSDGCSFCFAGLLLLVSQRVSLNDGEGTVKMRRVVSLRTK